MNDQKTNTPLSIVCKSCGAHLESINAQDVVKCPYCGTTYSPSDFLNESDAVKVERIKAQAATELEAARMKDASEKAEREETKTAIEKFKKGKFSKFLIICTIISALVAALELSNGFSMAGVIALVQAGLYLTSWLMGMGFVWKSKRNMRTLITVIAFALIIPFLMFFGNSSKPSHKTDAEKISWADIEMHERIPEPEILYGEIHSNSETSLWLTLCNAAEKDFKNYREACIKAGYTIDADKGSTSYSGFNQDGYKVRVYYTESSKELNIDLDAPEKMEEFEWPARGLGSMLPATKSNIGNICWDNSETFIVHVGNTPIEDFKEYIKTCEEAGFTLDYSKTDEYYSAFNADGYKIALKYLGFNRIEVSLSASENGSAGNKDTTPAETTKPTETTKPAETTKPEETQSSGELVNGMRPEFKEAMDSYEDFMDEYCSFMKKYYENPNDLTLLADYANMMSKYYDYAEDFEKWENAEMNAAETAYYIEVQTRVNKKLFEIANG